MGKTTSKILQTKIEACDPNVGPLLSHFRQFSSSWNIKDLEKLHISFKKNPTGYGLVFGQFEALLSFKSPSVTRLQDVFKSIDEDNNGRIDALEFIAGLALCCKGTFEDKARFCFELVDFNINGSLCFEELVLMMRSCVSGLIKFMGHVECPPDEEFELLAADALNSIKSKSRTVGNDVDYLDSESGAINFDEFSAWAMVNREVLTSVERMTVGSLVIDSTTNDSDDSAEDLTTDDESDLEEEHQGVLARAIHATDQKEKSEKFKIAAHNRDADQDAAMMNAIDDGAAGGDEFMAVKPWLATIKEPTNFSSSKVSNEAPDANLTLEWVYGYSAQDQRNNLRYVLNDSDGITRMVYPAAAIGVVYNPRTHTQQFYHGHDDDITCLTMHPDGEICATGQLGKDPSIHVWLPITDKTKDTVSPTTINTLSGFHRRGISQLAFSPGGHKLASIGMDDDHSIAIYDWRKGKIVASGKGDKSKLLACAFVPGKTGSSVELCVVGNKVIKFFTITGRGLKSKRGLIGSKKGGKIQPFLCLAFSGSRPIVGCLDGSLYLFNDHKLAQVVSAHTGPVTALYSASEGLISGGKDGQILWWNTSLKAIGAGMDFKDKCFDCAATKPRIASVCFAHDGIGSGKKTLVGTRSGEIFEIEQSEGVTDNAEDQKHAFIMRISKSHFGGELWGLATHPHKHYFVTCGDDKTVRLWDANLRRQKAFRLLPLKARGAAISPDGTRIALALWDGTVYILDGELKRVIKKVKDAKKWGSVIQYSPDGKTLAFGSHDSRIYLYNTVKDMYSKRAICKAHSSYITALDFTTDSRHLQSTCGGYELLYWTIGGNRVTSAAAMRDQKWETWTCTLGWPVQGIWPAGADGTDINSCAMSHTKDLIVSGDDFGQVRMMRYPCLDVKCGDRSYDGHAQHVMGVRFTFDDSHVLSTGGGDRCIFQWTCEYEEQDEQHDNDQHDRRHHGHGQENKEDEIDAVKIEHRTRLQEAGRGGAERDALAEIFEEQSQQGGDEFMAVKPWLGTITRMKPKDFDPRSISNDAPDVDMELYFVHGYRGNDCRNNLRYTAKGEVCYPAAALGIVYSPKESGASRQRFFDMHTDDVLSLAMHPQGKVVATGEIGRTPKIIVWDTDTMESLAILKGFHKRGVTLLAFSEGRGDRLASVGLDNDFSIAVYAWEQKVCLATSKGSKSRILGLRFGKDINTLVTCGVRHVSFWEIKGTTLKSQKGLFGRSKNAMQTAVTIGTVNDSEKGPVIVTGMANGQIYTWDTHKLKKKTPKFNPKKEQDWTNKKEITKGKQRAHSKAVTAMWSYSDGLISGSADGTIIMWDNDLTPLRIVDATKLWWNLVDPTTEAQVVKKDDIDRRRMSKNPGIQSLSIKDGKLLVGTKGCEIIELDTSDFKKQDWTNKKEIELKKIPIMHGHCSGETWGLAVHPTEDQFITCGDDKTANLWDSYDRYLKNSVDLKKKARSVAISYKPLWNPGPNPGNDGDDIHHAAFGLFNGEVVIHRADLSTIDLGPSKVIASFNCCKEWIQDMKFSPNNKMLAVSSHDNMIYIIDIDSAKQKYMSNCMAICQGHSSYIAHIDFSQDSRYIQSTCGAYELLFWDTNYIKGKNRTFVERKLNISNDSTKSKKPRKIKQVTHVAQFTGKKWNTFTVPLGWDVQGIWPPNVDGTDINAVERSHGSTEGNSELQGGANGNLIAIADDFGMVKLMRYPCVSNSQLSKSYRGHSAHVTNVVFHREDSFVISTGGGDNCVFMWQTDYVPGDDVTPHNQSTALNADHGSLHEIANPKHKIEDPMDRLMSDGPGGGDEFMAVKPWLGAIVAPAHYGSTEDSFDEPSSELNLNFIYGFSANLRNSVYFDKHGNYIYASAATGVVYNPNEHKQRFNRTLTDDILSCSLSPDGNTCAMGEQGRKPKICIWDVHSGNTLLMCEGFHRRGITLLAWSPSGRMLASIGLDDDHSLAVWDTETGQLIASSKGHQSRVLGLLFKSENEIIIVGVKHTKFFTLNQRRLKGKAGIFGKKGKLQPVLCVAALGTNVVTGQADGTLYLWQGRNCQMKTERKKADSNGKNAKGHVGPVTAIWTMAREGVISGGRDGIVIVWDRTLTELKRFDISKLPSAPRAISPKGDMVALPCGIQSVCASENQILVATESASIIVFAVDDINVSESNTSSVITGHFRGETWGLARHPSKAEFVTCGDDKTVRRWDSAHQRAVTTVLLSDKARAVAYAPDAAHIAVGLFSGRVEIFNSDLSEKIKGISVCREWIQDLKYSPDKKYLAVSSHDNHIYIFDRKTYMRTAIMKGHSSYITHIDFSLNSKYLQSNCGAYELLFWDVKSGKQITSASSLRDQEWKTWTCTLGWPVQGIWPAEADGTDVNAVDRSPNQSLLATADDFGKVKLFRYPAPQTKGCEYRESKGHSSHVTNVRFLHDGQTVISTGGNDRCIFHWDVQGAKVRKKGKKQKQKGGKGRKSSNPPAPQSKGGRRPPKQGRRKKRR